jgi:hypothetical protein
MSDLIAELEALADALVGHEWELPIMAVEDVRAAIAEIKRLRPIADYIDDPRVLLLIPQPHRLRLSELLHPSARADTNED